MRELLKLSARRAAVPAVVVAVVIGVGWLLRHAGAAHGMVASLIVIGFSPDRSVLIAAMTIEALAVALGSMLAPRRLAAIAGGAVVLWLIYHHTFEAETKAALAASGASGTFDLGGWLLTLATLAVAAVVIGWAVSTLTAIARAEVGRAIEDLRSIRSGGVHPRRLARPGLVAAVALLLIGTMPVLGDMLNYEPDVAMRHQVGRVGLGDTGTDGPLPSGASVIPATTLDRGGVIGPSASPGVGAPTSVLSHAKPWLAWRPSGAGSVVPLDLPSPYRSGTSTTGLAVYLPPGYATSSRRYPVLYAVPWSINPWQKADAISSTLDALIDGGTMAASIVVFAPEGGGPFADSECADSKNGREWYATWLVHSVVPRIDATYRTVASPAARAVIGFSQGGFCAPMFVLRDPTVFGTAISFSGYAEAGIRSSQTVNAWIPFGGDAAYEAGFSPLDLAGHVATALRPFLFVELSASPTQPFYGAQYAALSSVLKGAGIPEALFPTALGHAWAAIRNQLPVMLQTWSARMAALSVFGP